MGRVGDLNPEYPAVIVWIGVDEFWVLVEAAVDTDDLSRDGGVYVGGSLDGLEGSGAVARLGLRADLWEIGEDDVAQGGLGVVGDADGGDVTFELGPLVGVPVLAVRGVCVGVGVGLGSVWG